MVHKICQILSENIGPQIVKIPVSKHDITEANSYFLQKPGFHQVIGCINVSHIPIKQPSENACDYFSYKMTHTINCQAVCDAFGKLINVDVTWPGSLKDARIFAKNG